MLYKKVNFRVDFIVCVVQVLYHEKEDASC